MSWQSRRYFVTIEISRKEGNVAGAMGHTRGSHQQPGTVRGLYWRAAVGGHWRMCRRHQGRDGGEIVIDKGNRWCKGEQRGKPAVPFLAHTDLILFWILLRWLGMFTGWSNKCPEDRCCASLLCIHRGTSAWLVPASLNQVSRPRTV